MLTISKDWPVGLAEYVEALESARRDLWGVNEELRQKIDALEKGQIDLIDKLETAHYALRHLDIIPNAQDDLDHIMTDA